MPTGLEGAIGEGASSLITQWGPPGFFLLLSIAANIFQFRANTKIVEEHRKEVADLNKTINSEIKAGITAAEAFRETFDKYADQLEKRGNK